MRAALGAAMMMMLAVRADAADVSYSCDLSAVIASSADSQTPACYVTQLQIGSVTLTADLFAFDHATATSKTAAAAFIQNYAWNTATTGPMKFNVLVSAANAQRLKAMGVPKTTATTVGFSVKAFDAMKKAYFVALAPTATLTSAITASSLQVGTTPADANGAKLYQVTFDIVPPKAPAAAQNITLATSSTAKVVKPWGPTP
jgi:hypothetical protein